MNFSTLSFPAATAVLVLTCAPAAMAVTLQITIANVAPSGTIALAPSLSAASDPFDISGVSTMDGPEAMGDALPALDVSLAFQPTGSAFPGAAGGAFLPLLQPGGSLSFLLNGTDFTTATSLLFGAGLTGSQALTLSMGSLEPLSFTLNAGQLLEFVGGEAILPDGFPGSTGLLPGTPVFQFSAAAVPEPGSAAMLALGAAFALRRKRRQYCQ